MSHLGWKTGLARKIAKEQSGEKLWEGIFAEEKESDWQQARSIGSSSTRQPNVQIVA